MLRLGGKTVALSTECSVEDTMELIDARTKDDTGAADEPGEVSHIISTDALLGMNDNTTQLTYARLKEIFHARRRVTVEVMLAAGSREALSAADWLPGPIARRGFYPYRGEAYIKSLRLSGNVGSKAAISVQLAVQGEMVPAAPPSVAADVVNSTLVLSGSAEVIGRTLVIEDQNVVVRGNTLVFSEPEPEPINN